MKDLQILKPEHEIEINKVGITNLVLPLKVRFNGKISPVTAKINAFVDLDSNERGTHMSRIIRILTEKTSKEIDYKRIEEILDSLKEELGAKHSYISMEFILFKMKKSPVAKKEGFVSYKCFIESDKNAVFRMRLGAEVLVTSLCPISKEVSKYSAHNQRGELKAKILSKNNKIWFEEIINSLEKGGSCELFSVLKREDEKYVTEKAYDNPKIVEDIVREVAVLFRKNKQIAEFSVSCENFESIHMHNAFSEITMQNGR